MTKKTKQAKRPACKPVKAWAVVYRGRIVPAWIFRTRGLAVAADATRENCVVPVEIREIREAKR